eukprot:jgi/Ulvmu1/7632/UM038_0059.1
MMAYNSSYNLARTRAASLRRFSKCTAAGLAHAALSQTTQRRCAVVRDALPVSGLVWLPGALPAASTKVPDLVSWFLAHPFWTMVAGTVLVTIIPRVTKALWRFVVAPIVLVAIGYTIGRDPERAASTAKSLLEFGQTHPTAMSVAIVAVVAILITPYIIPLVLTGAICVFLWDPKALTRLLPAPPPVPTWMLPAPLKAITSPKTWFESLDSSTQQSPAVKDLTFNPIARRAIEKENPAAVGRPVTADKPAPAAALPAPAQDATPATRPRASSPSQPSSRVADLDTDFQVPRLAPAAAVSVPTEAADSQASDGLGAAEPRPLGPLRGLLGTLGGSNPASSTQSAAAEVAEVASPPAACPAGSTPEDCTLAEASPAGLLQRARALKPLEAMGRVAGRMKEAALDELAEEAGVARQPGQEPRPGDEQGSRAAAVRDRLEQALPEKLRPGEVGRWLPGLALGSSTSGAEGPGAAAPQVGGADPVKGALGRFRNRLKEVKEEFGSEDRSVRKLGEKVRAAAGTAATVVAAAEEETRPRAACSAGETSAEATGGGGAAGKQLRGFVQKVRTKLEVGAEAEGGVGGAKSGCEDVAVPSAAGRGREASSTVEAGHKVEGSVAGQKGDQAAVTADPSTLRVLGSLPIWMMFW